MIGHSLVAGNRPGGLISKIALQIADFYDLAARQFSTRPDFDKAWLPYATNKKVGELTILSASAQLTLTFVQLYFQAEGQYRAAPDALAAERYGEWVCRLRQANGILSQLAATGFPMKVSMVFEMSFICTRATQGPPCHCCSRASEGREREFDDLCQAHTAIRNVGSYVSAVVVVSSPLDFRTWRRLRRAQSRMTRVCRLLKPRM